MKQINTDDCWLWAGKVDRYGYGGLQIWIDGKDRYYIAHRIVYQTLVGPIPEGLDLDHLCKVKLCVNPEHLEPVTKRVNTQRRFGVTLQYGADWPMKCARGHELTPDNVYIVLKNKNTGTTGKTCKTCISELGKKRYRIRKANMSRKD